MKILKYLKINTSAKDIASKIVPKYRMKQLIKLDEDVSEQQLDKFWDEVVEDIHKDPTWFDFSEK